MYFRLADAVFKSLLA